MGNASSNNNAEQVKSIIIQSGVIAILRGNFDGWFVKIAQTLANAGVMAMEVTMNSPKALEGIQLVRQELGDKVLMGAGTVLSAKDAAAVIDAGARFVVAPNTNPQVIKYCVEHAVCVIPGAYTATEIMTAVDLGANLVKIFPADLTYFKAIRGPLNKVPFVPTGGVDLHNAADFIKAGAVGVGMGSALIGEYVKQADGLQVMYQRATDLIHAVRAAKGL
ncbi:MAG: bifunctional 4-hydroxy-2-oxoglutarate aldolase/2-dehydro-3-deoxy-phosphogluconate aldolase [Chloroflexi bacterium]|nr:bifunctional 4-hydroxy-2-oxoglutarate aldolase/2-dehydro-3-deoxy-phosphogluconate aldolase [Chloroflexota bacterium]MCL5273682.1 bifunctional 4-hydroxy-2-oxoglutarate aldolase/2-dehydro-3-deoxy-phosphogluconate aldolase [Chloroflexota bacterium]